MFPGDGGQVALRGDARDREAVLVGVGAIHGGLALEPFRSFRVSDTGVF